MQFEDQLVKQCILFMQMQFEKVSIKTDEDLEQLRLAWLAIVSGDLEPIVFSKLKEAATLMHKMYQDAPSVLGAEGDESSMQLKEKIKDAIWAKADYLAQMKSGKLKKEYIKKWREIQKLTEEHSALKKQVGLQKQKIDKLREEG